MTAEKLNPQDEIATQEEIIYSNMVQHEALLRLLFKKRIITKDEYLEEVKGVSRTIQQRHVG
ncbi:hypothetical protein [Desulfonatronovibrio hydrogenovorans]|uniref:hypothetical protein n=1 Tax=Desulfonatronovibrio hydrogenovorans TaxID=53245 RepID=UPI0012378696|nr:hypothetical protein [Desulfonatronovibrio hydrogenovorans]